MSELPGDPNPPYGVIAHGTVLIQNNGEYALQACVELAGGYDLHVVLNEGDARIGAGGVDVASSPYSLICTYGTAYADTSNSTGPELSTAVAGNVSFIEVTVRDIYGNLVRGNSSDAQLTAELLNDPSVMFNVSSYNNGTFTLQYIARKSGNASLSLLVSDVPIFGSPFTVTVTPGLTSAAVSFATGMGLVQGIVGLPSTFAVTSLDAEGNRQLSDVDSYVFTATPLLNSTLANLTGSLLPCQLNIPACGGDIVGRYFGSFVPTLAGVWNVSLLLNSPLAGLVEISDSPFLPLVSLA